MRSSCKTNGGNWRLERGAFRCLESRRRRVECLGGLIQLLVPGVWKHSDRLEGFKRARDRIVWYGSRWRRRKEAQVLNLAEIKVCRLQRWLSCHNTLLLGQGVIRLLDDWKSYRQERAIRINIQTTPVVQKCACGHLPCSPGIKPSSFTVLRRFGERLPAGGFTAPGVG